MLLSFYQCTYPYPYPDYYLSLTNTVSYLCPGEPTVVTLGFSVLTIEDLQIENMVGCTILVLKMQVLTISPSHVASMNCGLPFCVVVVV